MLQEWILKIRQNSRYYSTETWKYRVSGNVLEFSVPQKFTHDRETYRCSVITIGQILKHLSYKIEKLGYHFRIQSFPNLESPEVIASIRMEEYAENDKNPFPVLSDYDHLNTVEDKLVALADAYQFKLSLMNRSITSALNKRYTLRSSHSWFVLSSKHDNPFIWLSLGNWKETLLMNDKKELDIRSPIILDLCIHNEPEDLYFHLSDNEILQALLTAEIK